MAIITLKALLEAGVQFGHPRGRWNPKMKKFIYGVKEGVHIIDLRATVEHLKIAYEFLYNIAFQNKGILFVGTKKQVQEIIRTEARRCGVHYVANKWLGGVITNFETIKKSIAKLQELNEMKSHGIFDLLSRKEKNKKERERLRLEYKLEGIKGMTELPGAVVVADPVVDEIPVHEANKMKIPVVAICDTNADPDLIDYPIPANDDAIGSVGLIFSFLSDAIIEGKNKYEKEKLKGEKELIEEAGITKAELEEPIVLGTQPVLDTQSDTSGTGEQ